MAVQRKRLAVCDKKIPLRHPAEMVIAGFKSVDAVLVPCRLETNGRTSTKKPDDPAG